MSTKHKLYKSISSSSSNNTKKKTNTTNKTTSTTNNTNKTNTTTTNTTTTNTHTTPTNNKIKLDSKPSHPTHYTIDLIVLPNQLFPFNMIEESIIKSLSSANNIKPQTLTINLHLLEHPVYYGDRKRVPNMKFNKKKLVYHRATSKLYLDTVTNHSTTIKLNTKQYYNYTALKKYKQPLHNIITKLLKHKNTHIALFDPVDHEIHSEIKPFATNPKLHILDSLLFINTNSQLQDYHNNHNKTKSFFHASFYSWQKTQLDILKNTKSYDTENRNKMPKSIKVPSLPINTDSKTYKSYILEAIKYVNQIKKNNYGTVNNESDIIFPLTRTASIKWLEYFCKHKLNNFGKYQDSIDSEHRNYLFHSCISPMLNIGIITPMDVVNTVKTYYDKHKSSVGISNFEGFIRQVIGWREYQQYCYKYAYDDIIAGNYFNNKKKLNKSWYEGTLDVKPVDDAIKMAWSDAYLHHILRLMVMGNFMNLCGIHPDEVYKWFMEFSIDSYDWVMIQNVYSMAMWSDGGLTMHKPYISSDGYIMKMSTYSKESDNVNNTDTGAGKYGWNTIWYSLFYNFINVNKDKLVKTYYAGMIKNWNKKTDTEKQSITAISRDFISRVTI
jgi:deoxyribodipyrimidine photolyase-related protein